METAAGLMVGNPQPVCGRAPTTEAGSPLHDPAERLAWDRRDGNCRSL